MLKRHRNFGKPKVMEKEEERKICRGAAVDAEDKAFIFYNCFMLVSY